MKIARKIFILFRYDGNLMRRNAQISRNVHKDMDNSTN